MISGTCQDCQHSRITQQMGQTSLYCHERSPTPLLLPGRQGNQVQLVGIWPPVDKAETCSRFKLSPFAKHDAAQA